MNIATPAGSDARALPKEPAPRRLADAIRILTIDAVEKAKSGHPGMPMGMADAAVALFATALKFDPADPEWPDRDRLVLSAGHGSMLLYAALHLTGYPGFDRAALEAFRSYGSLTAGHPEVEQAHGIETTTGPLGQGVATAVGMALAERMLNARFGDDLVNHYTYVIASDGDLMEGVSHEACSLAGHLRLNRLIVLYDDNEVTIDGPADLSFSEDVTKRFEAYGWAVVLVEGHDHAAVAAALARAQASDRPTLIRCKTVIGWGAPTKAGDPASHSGALGEEEIAGTRRALDWNYAPFEVPEEIARSWRRFAEAGAAERAAWKRRYEAADPTIREAFDAALAGTLPQNFDRIIADFKRWAIERDKPEPTRFSSGHVLERLVPAIDTLVGGSGDLTPANNTLTAGQGTVARGSYAGRYIHYGVREHAMAAIMNGLALHKGFIPYAGTFLAFTDYCRPAIRLAALMEKRVIHVMTHDSIGLGQDGPTHQPIEHLAGLRAMPGIRVFRPADAVEVAECWALALRHDTGPSILALSRQDAPLVRRGHTEQNLCARGAYILQEAGASHRATLLATGTEVALALRARVRLEAEGIGARVVSMPCLEIFELQDDAYRAKVLGAVPVRIAIEAAARLGWDRYHGGAGGFVGMNRFGASAPAGVLYEKFAITEEVVVAAVKARLLD
ncbi:transketolase [Chelativorans salis]|uniref:Transketolase n=1 Tax=Chelativorans salis TaxID=2978478 RepID=A0ABT2LUF3_9HYPH|nr:transketolase [Chelativorans sp. EGI FJ00035]MCT7378158.1 transketolase [Chelativorans sp. EGI FJ00035]